MTLKEKIAQTLFYSKVNRPKGLWVAYFDDAPILNGKAYISPAKARARILSKVWYGYTKQEAMDVIHELEKEGLLTYKQAQ